MNKRLKVYELAKEINLSNRTLLDLLKKLGINATSHSYHLKESEIAVIRNHTTSSRKEDNVDIKLKQDVAKPILVEDRITTITESIRSNPVDSQLYLRRGILYSHLGKTKEALNDYNRSLKLDSKFVKAYYARAELFATLNNMRLAMMDLEKALELESSQGKVDSVPIIFEEEKENIVNG